MEREVGTVSGDFKTERELEELIPDCLKSEYIRRKKENEELTKTLTLQNPNNPLTTDVELSNVKRALRIQQLEQELKALKQEATN